MDNHHSMDASDTPPSRRPADDVEEDVEEGEIVEAEASPSLAAEETERRGPYKQEEARERKDHRRERDRDGHASHASFRFAHRRGESLSRSPGRDALDRHHGRRRSRSRDRSGTRDRRRRVRSRSPGRRKRRYVSLSRSRSPSRSRSRRSSRRDREYLASKERRRGEDRDGTEQKEEDEEIDDETRARIEAALDSQEVGTEDDSEEQKLIEERRKRRQEILMKYRQQQSTGTAQEQGRPEVTVEDRAQPSIAKSSQPHDIENSRERDEAQIMAEIGMEDGILNIWRKESNALPSQRPSIVGPTASALASGVGESKEQAERRLQESLKAHHEDGAQESQEPPLRTSDGGHAEESDESDVEDIFAATPEDAKALGNEGNYEETLPKPRKSSATLRRGLVDSYDDAEGYYNFQVGEVLAERYEVVSAHGRGVFSSVLRAKDLLHSREGQNECAVKVIRANDTMYKAGQMERVILRKLAEADREGRRHCIRLLGSFEYRNHLCLVFEPMDMDLRALTKRYGRGIGLSLSAVRVYAQQMLVALLHLKNCGVLHADIKPDNILVNDRRTVLKLCDFGSAMFAGDNEITPYLVSRFYRSPEVRLGIDCFLSNVWDEPNTSYNSLMGFGFVLSCAFLFLSIPPSAHSCSHESPFGISYVFNY